MEEKDKIIRELNNKIKNLREMLIQNNISEIEV